MPSSAQKRPSSGTLTARVWEIADRISLQAGRRASSTEVIDAVVRDGGNANTAATQYQAWKKTFVLPAEATPARVTTDSVVVQMGRDGRVLVPQALRAAMGVDDTTKLTARVENGELRIVPQKLALARLQALVKAQDKGKGSAVDELLADRRADASR
jgi:bifunctional DNA-binding transcriptional regulator/antitoxin component of YhaV-PrlF toxin-antitoxin module